MRIINVAAITTRIHKFDEAVIVSLPAGRPLTRESQILTYQVTAIDKSRLGNYLGSLATSQLKELDNAMRQAWAISDGVRDVDTIAAQAVEMWSRVAAGHVFISYVREDSHRVDKLQEVLEAREVPVWRDTTHLWPGENWRTKIRREITDNALVFIACFSQTSLARGKSYQNEELTLAIEQLRLRPVDEPWLIPVRFDECEIPDLDIGGGRTLTSIQRADLFGDRLDESTARLVEAVLRILGQQTGAVTADKVKNSAPTADRVPHRLEKVDDALNIDALIDAGEGDKIEFKSSLHHPYGALPPNLQKLPPGQASKQIQRALRRSITKTIAAFLNTVGGTLLIGVSDSGTMLGIEPDFAYLGKGKNNSDGWLLSLRDAIINALGPEVWNVINVSLVPHGQQTVAVVNCARRTIETWHREEGREVFYIRTSNATQELIGSSILRYIREHWPA
jgi:hypothetical protein